MAVSATSTRSAIEALAIDGCTVTWRAHADALFLDHAVFRLVFNRFSRVSPKLFRSGQPTPAQLRRWQRTYGIRTVINLRGRHRFATYHQAAAVCADLGLTLIDFPLDSRDAPQKERVLRLLDMAETLDYPVLAHCKSGADRAGLFAAIFLHAVEGQPIDRAQRQLSLRFGHWRQSKTGILDFFLERYVAEAKGKPFRQWIENDYDPAALKAAFMGQWWANTLVDKVLRRE